MGDVVKGGIDRGAEAVDDEIDLVRRDDVGWRQQHVVAATSVHGSARRIAAEPALHGGGLNSGVQLEGRVKRLVGAPVRH